MGRGNSSTFVKEIVIYVSYNNNNKTNRITKTFEQLKTEKQKTFNVLGLGSVC